MKRARRCTLPSGFSGACDTEQYCPKRTVSIRSVAQLLHWRKPERVNWAYSEGGGTIASRPAPPASPNTRQHCRTVGLVQMLENLRESRWLGG
jgi:hypothetical protein